MVTRRIIVGLGLVVVAFLVVQTYLVWWPSFLDTLATMHGAR